MGKDEIMKEKKVLESTVLRRSDFPSDFVFGVATSAYQIEGGYKEGGRGLSIWDAFSHTKGKILDGKNGDVAVDHYHRYREDIELMAKLGFRAYRLSFSWSRIFPDGLGTKVNDAGVAFYKDIIETLHKKNIEPYVTLYHWDLPLHLEQTMGGWLNKDIVKYFAIYAETCFAIFGHRVKNWITINEPLEASIEGYDTGFFAPGRNKHPETEPYLAAHHQILAHAAAVSIYRRKFKGRQGGKIGIVLDCEWGEPNSVRNVDKMAAETHLDFQIGWFLHPIYYGEYPEIMRRILGNRLPEFSEKDKELLRNPIDFVGLNQYTSKLIAHNSHSKATSYHQKVQSLDLLVRWQDGELIGEKTASDWLYVCPWGMRRVINHIVKKYKSPPIYITENGMDDEDSGAQLHALLHDELRIKYYRGYLASVHEAIKNGANVKGFFAWSFMDNFEWADGYTKRFGLVYVDYKNGLTRCPKLSAYWFSWFLGVLKREDWERRLTGVRLSD